MRSLRLRRAAGLIAVALVGCVDKSPPPPAVDPALVAENLLSAPPTDIAHRVDASFGGGIVYLGNTIEQPAGGGAVTPGDKITVVHYWQVNQAPPKGYRVFSHLQGDGGDYANVDLTDMRKGHPPDTWRTGEVIRDRQTFVLRKDWRSPKATLVVGLYKKGSPKVTDRLAVTGAPSKDGAVPVASFDIDLSKMPPPPGTVIVKKATGAIVVDGKADEPDWQTAATTAGFVTAEGGPEPKGTTSARLTWNDQFLYVFVSASDSDVSTPYTKADDSIWKADVIEVFIDADANGKGYVELQVSPTNVQFDKWYPAGRGGPEDMAFAAGMITAVNVRGTVNAPSDEDQGWDAEFAIPLAAVKGGDAAMAVRLPPQPGDTWRVNVVRVDYPAGGQPAAASWNRIRYSDFHSLDRMLTIRFGDSAGNLTAGESAPAAPAPTTPTAPTTGTPPVAPAPVTPTTLAPVTKQPAPGGAGSAARVPAPPADKQLAPPTTP